MLISRVEVPKLKETKEDTKGPQTEPLTLLPRAAARPS